METLSQLFRNNRAWAAEMDRRHPGIFAELSHQQAPRYLWIGCSDSRVPANEIVGLRPGELFVHRNIANIVVHGEPNCMSVIQYAVEVLRVEHIIVCGHYGCGGVAAAMQGTASGFIGGWLSHIAAIARRHERELSAIADVEHRSRRLCELNVIQQVANVRETEIVRTAAARGQDLHVHGWIYDIRDGLLHDLQVHPE